MSGLFELLESSDLDIEQKIVQELLNNNENLETKTELQRPMLWAGLSSLKEFYEANGMKASSSILSHFSQIAFRYLISLSRKGRLEYLDALKGLKERMESEKPSAIAMGQARS